MRLNERTSKTLVICTLGILAIGFVVPASYAIAASGCDTSHIFCAVGESQATNIPRFSEIWLAFNMFLEKPTSISIQLAILICIMISPLIVGFAKYLKFKERQILKRID